MNRKSITALMVEPNEHPKTVQLAAGVFCVVGRDECGELISLSAEKIEDYQARFWEPEDLSPQDVEHAIFMRFFGM